MPEKFAFAVETAQPARDRQTGSATREIIRNRVGNDSRVALGVEGDKIVLAVIQEYGIVQVIQVLLAHLKLLHVGGDNVFAGLRIQQNKLAGGSLNDAALVGIGRFEHGRIIGKS